MTRVAIAGAAGRMGRSLIRSLAESHSIWSSELTLGLATVAPDDPCLGLDTGLTVLGERNDVPFSCQLDSAPESFDVVIDFTTPEASLGHLETCLQHGKPLVIGTTGFSPEQSRKIDAVTGIPIVFAPNMSVGVNLCLHLLEQAARMLGDGVDIEIVEAHHRDKKDAPSGTALKMGQVIAESLSRNLDEVAVYGRQGISGRRERETIGFATIRAGDIVGDHTVIFAGDGERVEITHRAIDRSTFANGALRAAAWVASRPPGVYTMRDVLKVD